MDLNPADYPVERKAHPVHIGDKWYIETPCDGCLRMSMHVASNELGPYTCLRCYETVARRNFAAKVQRALEDLGLLDKI